jgi:hypothetical protein
MLIDSAATPHIARRVSTKTDIPTTTTTTTLGMNFPTIATQCTTHIIHPTTQQSYIYVLKKSIRFSSCPHGRCFTVLAQCFTISSWVSSLMAITTCFYIYIRPIPEEGEPELPREGFGYISRQVGVMQPPAYRQCVWYEDGEKEMFDGMWRAGKAMSLLACGVGGIVMCIVMCTCCVAFELPTFDGLFWTCLFCFVAQALTFLSWGSTVCDEMECTWASGTGMNITAAMLWIWAANMIKSFPEALPPRGRRDGGRRRRKNGDDNDDDMDDEDSPYLASNRSGFQDEYGDGDDDEYYDDDESRRHNVNGDGSYYADNDNSYYADENGEDWHTDDDGRHSQPQGYYDENGSWYEDDGSAAHSHHQPGYDGNDNDGADWYESDGSAHQLRQTDQAGPAGEANFVRDSQRTINQLD